MSSNGDAHETEVQNTVSELSVDEQPGSAVSGAPPQQTQMLADLQRRKWENQLLEYQGSQQVLPISHQGVDIPTPAPTIQGPFTLEQLSNLKLHEIKQILRDQKKKLTGNKEDLIARILGLEESTANSASPKKRKADQITDGDGTDGEKEEGEEEPPAKRFKVDKNDPLYNKCFLCQSVNNLVKYKDLRECNECKTYWKGKRLTKTDAHNMFLLDDQDLQPLPYKEAPEGIDSTQTTHLYAFATAAGAAVKKYGSLYHMVLSNPDQRAGLAVTILQEREVLANQHIEQHVDHENQNDHGEDV